jgi:hypothetical protein
VGEVYDYIKRELEQYGKDICEAAEKHLFGEGKEVIKEMAIDYGKEWKKLHNTHGKCLLDKRKILHGPNPLLSTIMDDQIKQTISKREGLMKEYLKSVMKTDISGGSKQCYYIGVGFDKQVYGNIAVSKAAFDAWCKKKKGGK